MNILHKVLTLSLFTFENEILIPRYHFEHMVPADFFLITMSDTDTKKVREKERMEGERCFCRTDLLLFCTQSFLHILNNV